MAHNTTSWLPLGHEQLLLDLVTHLFKNFSLSLLLILFLCHILDLLTFLAVAIEALQVWLGQFLSVIMDYLSHLVLILFAWGLDPGIGWVDGPGADGVLFVYGYKVLRLDSGNVGSLVHAWKHVALFFHVCNWFWRGHLSQLLGYKQLIGVTIVKCLEHQSIMTKN